MANKESTAKQPAKKANFFTRLVSWFKNLPGRIGRAFKNMVAELKKVTWPTRKELVNVSLIVLAFTSKNSKAPKAEGIPYDKSTR